MKPTRDTLADAALSDLPKMLTLLDRNPHSPTSGCFDRSFWHYKIIDFPSGMSQEMVWPLALVWSLDLPNSPYRCNDALFEWIVASLRFTARSARSDGSCDDYFPYERACGAASFALLGALESYRLLGLDDPFLRDFFANRGRWLARFHESGQLTNHQALVAIVMQRLGEVLQTDEFERARSERLERVCSWQHEEGWFREYEGFDPGYQTITISLLASMEQEQPDAEIRSVLERAVRLSADVIFPDGSNGGELGSRNTANFFPHGFELVGRWMPEALAVNDRFLVALAEGRAPCYADDRHLGHHLWNYLLAWRDWVTDRPSTGKRPEGMTWRPGAGLLIDRSAETELYLSTAKGGVFRLYRHDRLVASDTGISLKVDGARGGNAVSHLVDGYDVEIKESEVIVSGTMGWAKHTQMTTARLLFLRLFMLTVGRFFPNLSRSLLQRMLITDKRNAPFIFRRRLDRMVSGWRVTDEVRARDWTAVREAGIGAHQASIYVTMSKTYRRDQLLRPWRDLSEEIPRGESGQPLVHVRDLA